MCTSPWSCFVETGGTNRDLTWLQMQLSQQHFTWKSMISVFFQSPKELRLWKCCAQNFHLHRISVKQRSHRRILPCCASCTDFQTIIWAVLFQFYTEVLLWLPCDFTCCEPFPWIYWKESCNPEKSPENWNKGFSEIMQGSILPTPPNYTSFLSYSGPQPFSMTNHGNIKETWWDNFRYFRQLTKKIKKTQNPLQQIKQYLVYYI